MKCRFVNQCGGCDYLDLAEEEYYQIKIAALKNTLESLKNDLPINLYKIGANSRRRITLQNDRENNLGFFIRNSNEVVAIDKCYVALNEISQIIGELQKLIKNFENNLITQIVITKFDNVLDLVFSCKRELNFSQINKIVEFSKTNKINTSYRIKDKITLIFKANYNKIFINNVELDLDSEVFIQATKQGFETISTIIREFIKRKFNKKIAIADLYSGFGGYSFAIHDLAANIEAFEGIEQMTDLITKNAKKNSLSNKIKASMRDLNLYSLNIYELEKFDLIILNPPRAGAFPSIKNIAKAKTKNLIYVSCNPQTFVKDAKMLIDNGFNLTELNAIDQFYLTKHLELVAIFER